MVTRPGTRRVCSWARRYSLPRNWDGVWIIREAQLLPQCSPHELQSAVDVGPSRAGDAAENPRRLSVESAVQFPDTLLPGPRQSHDDDAAISSVPRAREEPVVDESGNGAADPALVEAEAAYEHRHRERAAAAE